MTGARLLTLLAALTIACSSTHDTEDVALTGPTRVDFDHVAEVLDYHCGNLSCHGSTSRNLRLYGDQGLRLDPGDIPCGAPTTDAELDADYRALAALEPEALATVVAANGEGADHLTLVRKPRSAEKHGGGTVFRDATDVTACTDACAEDALCIASCYGDRCLVSWIAGDVDVPACGNALPETRCNPG